MMHKNFTIDKVRLFPAYLLQHSDVFWVHVNKREWIKFKVVYRTKHRDKNVLSLVCCTDKCSGLPVYLAKNQNVGLVVGEKYKPVDEPEKLETKGFFRNLWDML